MQVLIKWILSSFTLKALEWWSSLKIKIALEANVLDHMNNTKSDIYIDNIVTTATGVTQYFFPF